MPSISSPKALDHKSTRSVKRPLSHVEKIGDFMIGFVGVWIIDTLIVLWLFSGTYGAHLVTSLENWMLYLILANVLALAFPRPSIAHGMLAAWASAFVIFWSVFALFGTGEAR